MYNEQDQTTATTSIYSWSTTSSSSHTTRTSTSTSLLPISSLSTEICLSCKCCNPLHCLYIFCTSCYFLVFQHDSDLHLVHQYNSEHRMHLVQSHDWDVCEMHVDPLDPLDRYNLLRYNRQVWILIGQKVPTNCHHPVQVILEFEETNHRYP